MVPGLHDSRPVRFFSRICSNTRFSSGTYKLSYGTLPPLKFPRGLCMPPSRLVAYEKNIGIVLYNAGLKLRKFERGSRFFILSDHDGVTIGVEIFSGLHV